MTFQQIIENKITPIDFANMSAAEQAEVKNTLLNYQQQAEDIIQDPELGDHNKAEYRENLKLSKKLYIAFHA